VVDRLVQQAAHLVLSPHFEPQFHGSSHGFRPGRSCHTAIAEAKRYLEEGCSHVVDIDLEKFFDRVHHERLLSRLERTGVHDRRVLLLIRRMLKAKVVMPDGVVTSTDEGAPQGGPLSPLLSNIVLDELDRELARRGHRFVRYADDCNVYVSSERAGERVMESVTRFIEKRLRLKVNADKSAVARPEERHFLGFRLRVAETGTVEVLLSKRSTKRLARKVRELTPRNWGRSLDDCITTLNEYLLGWIGFFSICSEAERRTLHNTDAHVRRRLRAILLRQRGRKRFIARWLIQMGARPRTAWRIVYEGKSSLWALSHKINSPIRNAFFVERGLKSVEQLWEERQPDVDASGQLRLALR
jgi:group II intron reverse transcriptase/maturase